MGPPARGCTRGPRAEGGALGIGEVLRCHHRPRGRRAPRARALFTLVADGLLAPVTPLAGHEHGVPERVDLSEAEGLALDPLDLRLDVLDTHVAAIERELLFRTAGLFRADVDPSFRDTTTVALELDAEDETAETRRDTTLPPLRTRGHSRESSDEHRQVIVGRAVKRDGRAVPGVAGTPMDATTVARFTQALRRRTLGRVVLVSDAGVNSATNRWELAKGLGHDIPAMPIDTPRDVQEEVLALPGRFHRVTHRLEVMAVVVGEGERRRR